MQQKVDSMINYIKMEEDNKLDLNHFSFLQSAHITINGKKKLCENTENF